MTVQGIGLVAVKLFEPGQRIERNNAFALRQHQQRIDLSLENGIVVSKLCKCNQGPGERPEIPQKPGARSFVIPINWRSHSAKLIVSLT